MTTATLESVLERVARVAADLDAALSESYLDLDRRSCHDAPRCDLDA
jgi:hypothetical protein